MTHESSPLTHPLYFDYAATCPVDDVVQKAMLTCLDETGFGNPSSTHHFGRLAATRVKDSAQRVAEVLGAEPSEILWTSGATESNNLAILGAAWAEQPRGRHLITVATEHKSVLEPFAFLAQQGFNITVLPVQNTGLIDLDALAAAITPETRLISVMWVNNETGVIQPIEAIVALAKRHGLICHVDAVQAAGKLPIDLRSIPIDLLSLSAHKFYGPKGSGVLFVRRRPRVPLAPLLFGGSQQHRQRPGTLPVHQIVGFAEALQLAIQRLTSDVAHIQTLNQRFIERLKTLPDALIHGEAAPRVPHILNLGFSQTHGQTLRDCLAMLALSGGSACNSAKLSASHVLTAMGLSPQTASQALRFSFGRTTSVNDVEQALDWLMQARTHLHRLAGILPLTSHSESPLKIQFPQPFAGKLWSDRYLGTLDTEHPSVQVLTESASGQGDHLTLYLKIERDHIIDVRVRVYGDASLVAVAIATAEMLTDQPLQHIQALNLNGYRHWLSTPDLPPTPVNRVLALLHPLIPQSATRTDS